MTNFFAGIYRANDALTAARYGLEVTGQNIANANTPGYTRQRADLQAVGSPVGVPMIHTGKVDNGGVQALGATRLGDVVLDARVRAEHARSAQTTTVATRLANLEDIFREPSDTGLAEQLNDYWNAWSDVANDPGGQVPREMLIASAQSTVTMLHSKNASLDDAAMATKNSLDAIATSVNTSAADLAELNRKIAIGSATGANINTLLDQRDVILDEMATMVGATAEIHGNGTVTVTVGGHELVSVGPAPNGAAGKGGPPFEYAQLMVSYGQTDPPEGASFGISGVGLPPTATPPGTGITLTDSAAAGELKALNEIIPKYRAALDKVAQDLATVVNGIQAGGYDQNGIPGTAMFTGTTARDIAVATGFEYHHVAASGTDSAGVGNLDASSALAAALAGERSDGPDAAFASLVGELGRASASAKQQQATQSVITGSVETLKATQSGVSFDEEVSNMLMYQMAFQASSRVLTTLDEMLDTLINRTGLVGR